MYFKVSMRHNPDKGFIDGYYRLIESYRNSADRVCHRTLLNVGFMDEVLPEQLNRIQKILTQHSQPDAPSLFENHYNDECPVVRHHVKILYERLVREKKIDVGHAVTKPSRTGRDWQTIDMNSLRNKDIREIGGEWLCYQSLNQLGMADFLANQGWEEPDIRLALTHIISRTIYPASELETSRWIKENSSVCEITGFPVDRITKDALYRISLRLYGLKDALEEYLSLRTNKLFDIEDKIILYDLTNTYFEGEMRGSTLARFGRSKEKRSDAKLVVLALVVNPEGFIKYSGILEGNVSDPSTLEGMINKLRLRTSSGTKKAIVVMDAGIATEGNLTMLRENGYDYLCVTRARMKNYLLSSDAATLTVTDNKKQKISLQKVSSSLDSDYYLKIESQAKKKKESSMNNQFKERFESGLEKIACGLQKKGGVKTEDKIYERIGRLKQKYPSIQRYFHIECQIKTESIPAKADKPVKATEKRIVNALTWTVKEDVEINSRSGVYFLRTSLDDREDILWESYNTIREIEYTNRVLKNDLDLRPIYHKKDESTMAHLHLGLLAYWVVNTIRYQLKKKEENTQRQPINVQWKEIVRIMNTQKAVTTLAQNKSEEVIMIRRCSEPNEKVRAIYRKLNYKEAPFTKKKFVVHKSEFEKIYPYEDREIRSD